MENHQLPLGNRGVAPSDQYDGSYHIGMVPPIGVAFVHRR